LKARDRHDVQEQGVAVGLGGGGELATDLAGGPGLGLDHHWLLDDGLQRRRERAADDVDGTTGRKRVDEGDGAGGIGLLRAGGTTRQNGGCRGRAGEKFSSVHDVLPEAPDLPAPASSHWGDGMKRWRRVSLIVRDDGNQGASTGSTSAAVLHCCLPRRRHRDWARRGLLCAYC